MYKVVILPVAKQDIRKNAKWYNKKQKGLGKRFTAEVRNTIKHIKHNPENIVTRYRSYKTAIVKVFPYMVHFLVNEDKKEITVYAVFAMKQSTENWDNL